MFRKISGLILSLILVVSLAACQNGQVQESSLIGEWYCVQLNTQSKGDFNLQQMQEKGINWILTLQKDGQGTTQSGDTPPDPITWETKDNLVLITDSFGDVYNFTYQDDLLYLEMEGTKYTFALKDSQTYQDSLAGK